MSHPLLVRLAFIGAVTLGAWGARHLPHTDRKPDAASAFGAAAAAVLALGVRHKVGNWAPLNVNVQNFLDARRQRRL